MAAFDSTVKGFFDSLSGIMPFQPESKALGGSKSNIKEVIKSEVTSPLGDLSNFFAGIDKSLVRLVEFARKTFNLEQKEDDRDKQTSDIIKGFIPGDLQIPYTPEEIEKFKLKKNYT